MPDLQTQSNLGMVLDLGRYDSNENLEQTELESGNGPRFHSAGDIHILILDDDPSICGLIKTALNHHQFSIDTVHQSRQMEKQVRENSYQLVILDYMIPGVNFEDMLNCVHQHQPNASIIVVTAYPSLDNVLHCLRARIHDYLPKPFDLGKLESTVLRCLDNKGLLRLSEEALRETLGAVIRERRKALDMTLADLAGKTNVSIGYLSQIELGKNSASIETLYRISLGLCLRLADLFHNLQPRI